MNTRRLSASIRRSSMIGTRAETPTQIMEDCPFQVCVVNNPGVTVLAGKYILSDEKNGAPLFNGPYGFILYREKIKNEYGWVIRDEGTTYYAVHTNALLPPASGWKAVQAGKEPNPTIEFVEKNSMNNSQKLSRRTSSVSGPDSPDYWAKHLHRAARRGEVATCVECFDKGCPIDFQEKDTGDTVTLIACEKGNVELLRTCIKRGGNVNPQADTGYNGLQLAVMNGWLEACNVIFETQDLAYELCNLPDPEGDYPVHLAAERGYLDIMKALVEQGADLSKSNHKGRTALHLSCAQGHYPMTQYIIKTRPSVLNSKDSNGNTPLHLAASRDKESIVVLLLDSHVDPDVQNEQGQTAYDLAISNNARNCIDILAPLYKQKVKSKMNEPISSAPEISSSGSFNLNMSTTSNGSFINTEEGEWKYFATMKYPTPPSLFMCEKKGTDEWDYFNTYYNEDGYPYFINATTYESTWEDPRGGDWFYAPADSYGDEEVENNNTFNSNENYGQSDPVLQQKVLSLEEETKELKEKMNDMKQRYEEASKNAEENHIAEIKARDETITRYYNELEKLKNQGMDPEKEAAYTKQIEDLRNDLGNVKRESASKTLKLQKLTRDFDTLSKKSKSERDNYEKEFQMEKMKIVKEYEARINVLESEDRYSKELNAVMRNADLEKKTELESLEKQKNREIKALQEENQKLKESIENDKVNFGKRLENEKKLALNEQAQEYQQKLTEMEALYVKEYELRKKLHNEIIEMKGNIRVLCRVRPFLDYELEKGDVKATTSYPREDQIIVNKAGYIYTFEYDAVFDAKATQDKVYEQVRPFVTSVLDGYNVCIFAYGQTGSGKTYTMQGPEGDPGVNFKALSTLFKEITKRQTEVVYKLEVSVLEIYNEQLFDLLKGEKSMTEALELRQTKEGVNPENLTKANVSKYADVIEVLRTSENNRSTGCHNMNEHSSRSHLIFTIYIHGENQHSKQVISSRLNLIDLAGSERAAKTGATGERLKEAQSINKSLSALGEVMNNLGSKSKHVPFRNSKLTHLLQDSLVGHSKVLMFVNISPSPWNVSETISSLQFASRCRSVELGKAVKNVK